MSLFVKKDVIKSEKKYMWKILFSQRVILFVSGSIFIQYRKNFVYRFD